MENKLQEFKLNIKNQKLQDVLINRSIDNKWWRKIINYNNWDLRVNKYLKDVSGNSYFHGWPEFEKLWQYIANINCNYKNDEIIDIQKEINKIFPISK